MKIINKIRSQKGFTGIEVIIVLVIVSIVVILVTNKLQESNANARDIDRRTTVNALQNALESHWHEHNSYPEDLTSLFASETTLLTDPSGNPVLSSSYESNTKPSHSYSQQAKPEQEITYAPYECSQPQAAEQENSEDQPANGESDTTDATETEAQPTTCSKYVIYSWLEKSAEIYERNNLHNIDDSN